jgi:predicted ester cyclase
VNVQSWNFKKTFITFPNIKGDKTMSTYINSAQQFFEACETGKGWEACSTFCHPEATFSSQATVLSEISTLDGYCEWMKNLLTPIPDGHYELKYFAADDARNSVAAFAVFHGTQNGQGGPVPPTGKTISAD